MSDELDRLLRASESETLEYKTDVRNPADLARLMAAFANARGGVVAVGVREPNKVVGSEVNRLRPIYEAALSRLTPVPETRFSVLTEPKSGRQVAAIDVRRSSKLVIADTGAFIRVGSSVRPMGPGDIALMLTNEQERRALVINDVAVALANLTKMVEELQRQLSSANSFRGQIKGYLIGGLLGAVMGLILTLLFG